MTGPAAGARPLVKGLLASLLLVLACAGAREAPLYLHNRQDYQVFRERFPELLEPNYLPFMTAKVAVPVADAGSAPLWRRLAGLVGAEAPADELLVFCRWPDEAFPLRVHVVPPKIADRYRDSLFPRPAGEYVAAVERALALWEEGLEGRDLFELVGDAADADLRIELHGDEAPTPDPSLQVLGATPLGDACQVEAGAGGSLTVRYAVSELRVFVADQHGLLLPDQVERIALHEVGHALGMHGHSPIPNDLMFRVARDRLPRGELGVEDVNSFLSLYAIPNGTVYAALPTEEPAGVELAPPPEGPPRLSLAPHVDARLGYEVQLPVGWTRVAMRQGVVAVDGVSWDYNGFFQIVVRFYPSLEAYMARYATAHLGGARIIEQTEVEVAGRRGLRFVLGPSEAGVVEEKTFLETGDGRVVVAIGESPAAQHAAFRPYFDAILDSLELHESGGRATDREYSPRPEGARPTPP